MFGPTSSVFLDALVAGFATLLCWLVQTSHPMRTTAGIFDENNALHPDTVACLHRAREAALTWQQASSPVNR